MNSTSFLPTQTLTLTYTLPILSLSIPLVFAGAFLTLDRTRSFPPQDAAGHKHTLGWFGAAMNKESYIEKLKRNVRFQGGVGGMCAGFIFGLELFTLLALLLPAEETTLRSLTGPALVVPAILSGAICAILASLLQPVALASSGLAGGLAAALGLSIITHPPLIARYIFLALLELGFLITLLIPRTRHVSLRIALAFLGAFGAVQSISLLAGFEGWSIPFDRLYINDGFTWGSREEKGMSALFSILLALGCGTDWILKKRFGQDPDQRWDSLLANITHSMPGRTGTFEPLQPWYATLLAPFQGSSAAQQPLLPGAYPVNTDRDLESKPPLTYMPTRTRKLEKSPRSAKTLSTGFSSPIVGKKRDPLVFAPSSLDSDSDSDDDGLLSRPGNPRSMTDATLVGDADDVKSLDKPAKGITVEKVVQVEVDIGDLSDAPPRPTFEPRKPEKEKHTGEWNAFWKAVHRKAGKS